jgi:hypothetical protein
MLPFSHALNIWRDDVTYSPPTSDRVEIGKIKSKVWIEKDFSGIYTNCSDLSRDIVYFHFRAQYSQGKRGERLYVLCISIILI